MKKLSVILTLLLSVTLTLLLLMSITSMFFLSPAKCEWNTPTNLTHNTTFDELPSISGDGSKIAFQSNVDGHYEIFLITEVDTTSTDYHDVVVDETTYVVETCSNSSVSELVFNQTAKSIRFSVDGTSGTSGFCNITIPAELMSGDFSIYKDDALLARNVDYTETYNGTHYMFSITY
jgi:hypothetical protein